MFPTIVNATPKRWTMEALKRVSVGRWPRSLPSCHVRARPYLGTDPSRYYSSSSHQRRSVRGRSAIVTGSSRGIGRAIALRLAADGYNVCVNDVGANEADCGRVVAEIEAMGAKACVAVADVSQREQVVRMVRTAVDELGPLKTM